MASERQHTFGCNLGAEMDQVVRTIASQRAFFQTHATRDVSFRIDRLVKLKQAVEKYERDILHALKKDLGKCAFEAYATEVGFVLHEITHVLKRIKRWARPERIRSDIFNLFGKSYLYHEPYGVVLIIAPWNYPFQLLFMPMVGAIAAGNCIAVKPAHYSAHTTEVIRDLITETFDPAYISIFTGGREVIQALLENRFDSIFFTGSPQLGKIVMEKAARHLTPVTLELGGKNPCIVEDDADIPLAAKRIVYGKLTNAGQTCIAPDFILANAKIKDRLMDELKTAITRAYGEDPQNSPDYGRIVNDARFDRLIHLIRTAEVVFGGRFDAKTRYIEPTLMDHVQVADPIMQEEIFGPLLPVLAYNDLDDVVSMLDKMPKPLALYFFSSDENKQRKILSATASGGGCINDTLLHITNPRMPFGGVGNSGMGGYHGKHTFDAFSHTRSMLKQSTKVDIPLRYAPYGNKLKIVRRLFR